MKIEQPGCRGFVAGDVVIFECNLGMKKKIPCLSCGRLAQFSCDFELKGKKQGQKCGRPLCRGCAEGGMGRYLCGPHARIEMKNK